jgi:hypothetical protein
MTRKGAAPSKSGPRSTASSGKGTKSTRVQVKNPVTGRYVKLDTRTGRIIDTKKSPGPYNGVPIKK